MRVICNNGFYKFYPQEIGEIRRFGDKYGIDLVQDGDYFTFTTLAELPNYSFKNHIYSGLFLGTVNYAGDKDDVMAKNGYTFYQETNNLILKSAIFNKMRYNYSNYIYMSTLPQAYSYDDFGIITGFSGFIDIDFMRFKIERFFYVKTLILQV